MLVQFRVSNFRSFDSEVVLSMVPSGTERNDLEPKALTKIAAIYGANASGKSNLVKAFQFVKDQVVKGRSIGERIPRQEFRLRSDNHEKPTYFEFVIAIGGQIYAYGFGCTNDTISEEWLILDPAGDATTLIDRKGDVTTAILDAVRLGTSAERLGFIAEGTQENQLLLTELSQRRVPLAEQLFTWFKSILVLSPDSNSLQIELLAWSDSSFASTLETLLREAGTGIVSVSVNVEPISLEEIQNRPELFPGMPAETRNRLAADVERLSNEQAIVLNNPSERWMIGRKSDGQLVRIDLAYSHAGSEGTVSFAEAEESDGTRRLIHLAPMLSTVCGPGSRLIIVDEIDRRLHPLLTELLVKRVKDRPVECMSQFVFTTHESYLLRSNLLDQDEVVLTTKSREGATHLRRLSEFQTEEIVDIERGYLDGRFEGIPLTQSPLSLGWLS